MACVPLFQIYSDWVQSRKREKDQINKQQVMIDTVKPSNMKVSIQEIVILSNTQI